MHNVKQNASPKRSRAQEEKRRNFGTRLWQAIVLGVLRGATGTMQRLSRPAALRVGRGLGNLGYRVARRQRRYADRNLRLVFGETYTGAERDALTRRVFSHFGLCVVDFLRGPAYTGPVLDRLVSCDGWEHVEKALAGGKGIIVLSAHLGNWELLGRWLAAKGVPLTVVAREPEEPLFAAYVRRIREGAGFTVLNKGESARGLLAVLRRGAAVLLMPDQNSGDVFVPFFGVPAGTVAGPASLALHTGAPIVPSYCVREGDGYRMLFLPPIPANKTENKEADVARIMTEANAVLEGVVRQYPDQWLWLHNRWKSAFEEKNRGRWPEGHDFTAAYARWLGP